MWVWSAPPKVLCDEQGLTLSPDGCGPESQVGLGWFEVYVSSTHPMVLCDGEGLEGVVESPARGGALLHLHQQAAVVQPDAGHPGKEKEREGKWK